jgi:hypothetical protein
VKEKSHIEQQVRITNALSRALNEYFSQKDGAPDKSTDSVAVPGIKEIERLLLGVLKNYNFNSS